MGMQTVKLLPPQFPGVCYWGPA